MDLYKITVSVGGRNIDIAVRQGILATVETGSHQNRVEKPEAKIAVLVGTGRAGLAAWVQVAEFGQDGGPRVTHEGWITEENGQIFSLGSGDTAPASVSRIVDPSPAMCRCHEDADFGPLACCTAYGNGCYVTCCGGCCSDSTKCPGASCCP